MSYEAGDNAALRQCSATTRRLRRSLEQDPVHTHVRLIPPGVKLGLVVSEGTRQSGGDGGGPGDTSIAVNDDSPHVLSVREHEVPDLGRLLTGEELCLREGPGRTLSVGNESRRIPRHCSFARSRATSSDELVIEMITCGTSWGLTASTARRL